MKHGIQQINLTWFWRFINSDWKSARPNVPCTMNEEFSSAEIFAKEMDCKIVRIEQVHVKESGEEEVYYKDYK